MLRKRLARGLRTDSKDLEKLLESYLLLHIKSKRRILIINT